MVQGSQYGGKVLFCSITINTFTPAIFCRKQYIEHLERRIGEFSIWLPVLNFVIIVIVRDKAKVSYFLF